MSEGLTRVEQAAQDLLRRVAEREAEFAKLPKCPVCGEVLEGEPCWTCREKAEREKIMAEQERARDIKRLGGLKAYEQFRLENYSNQDAIEACAGYPTNNLYIWGPAGVGKTHLATAIARSYHRAVVVKPVQIFRKCRGIKDGAEEQRVVDRIASIPQLVIDDIGVEKRTDFSMSVLYEIIETRDMNYINGLIVTSNLSLSALADRLGDDRVCSRLSGMCKIVEIGGADRRMRK